MAAAASKKSQKSNHPSPDREWYTFCGLLDERKVTFRLDVTFLVSGYHCIYGHGCRGTWDAPEIGCCNTGPDLTHEDIQRITALTGRTGWWYQRGDTFSGRTVHHKCIWHTGHGCSLHQQALARDESPIDWKPRACWQMPLWTEWDQPGCVLVITSWDKSYCDFDRHPDGWWCIHDRSAYSSSVPVYIGYADELTRIIGPDNYSQLKSYLDSRLEVGFRTQPMDQPMPNPMWPDHSVDPEEQEDWQPVNLVCSAHHDENQ